ncbi:TPA: LysR family transcriptional regulator [Vibrio parahaemolyticus]|nr:LysR family transcriptional regulator [Vibrio parahaemolyticus]
MKNKENLVVNGLSFVTRTEAARYFNINPKLVTERMSKRGWTLEQALELEPSPSRTYSKKVVIDGTEYSSMRQAARELGVAQSTLMNRIKAGIGLEEALSTPQSDREKLKGQSKPMFYQDKLYPSARHLLLANPALIAGGDLGKAVTSLNDKARRANNRGEIENLSIEEISVKYGLAKVRFVDEFDGWVVVWGESRTGGLFYEMK